MENFAFDLDNNFLIIFRTKEAMGGSMTFQEALRRRLDIIKPSQKQISDFLASHPSTLSHGIR